AEVYVELIGGRQASLILADERAGAARQAHAGAAAAAPRPEPRLFRVTGAEIAAHRQRLDILGDKAIWLTYLGA
ncbi:MAG: DNA polymerase III subunit epsilon, partial [Bauldia sp.]|nr:DNA polymerase III subunit epsilon [Bauldia sp.]